jgi:hypothetical protein
MGTIRLLLAVPVALATVIAPPPATAAVSCVAQWPGATYVQCPAVCPARSTIRVTVAGFAAGVASCGDADAYCRAGALPTCSGTDRTSVTGTTMACSVDPLGTQPSATATCEVVPSAS